MDREIAMGAQKWVDLYRYNNADDCIKGLRDKGYQIIATTPHNDSTFLDDFDITKRSALFFGRETQGLSEEVMQQADGFLKIPMVGFTESLNISVSAAITLQSVTNKLKKSDIDWKLSEKEQQEKRMQWTRKMIKSFDQILERYQSGDNGQG